MVRAISAVGPYVDDPGIMPCDDAAGDMERLAGLGVFPRDQQLGDKLAQPLRFGGICRILLWRQPPG